MDTSATIGRRRRSAGLYVRAVLAVGHLCEVRYRHAHAGTCAPERGRTSSADRVLRHVERRDERRAAAGPVLARVKATSLERVGYERLLVDVHPLPAPRLNGTRYELSPCGFLCSKPPATAVRASAKCGGNVRPRAAARRRIPRQAVALKKDRCGTSPVSKMSDKEDATPALGYSKVLSVQDSVGP